MTDVLQRTSTTAGTSRTRRLSVLALVAAPFLAVAAAFELINGFPHGLTYDDAYFYAQIAYNIGTSGHSSFDGITTTSGYHLLWGGILSVVSLITGLFTSDMIVHLYLFEVLFAGLALAVAWTFFARGIERFCALALIVMGTLLMETLLLSAMLLVFARAETNRASAASPPRLAAAMALLVPLARIDASLIVVVYLLGLAIEGQTRHAARLFGALAAGIGIQLGLMLWLFGEPFSVSSILKASNAAPFSEVTWASLTGPGGFAAGYAIRALLFLGLAVAATGVGVVRRHAPADRRLLYLSIGATAFSAGHVVSQLVPFWCYLPAYLVLFHAVTQARLEHPVLRTTRHAAVAGVALLGVVFLAHKVFLFARHIDVVRGARAFVESVERRVPAGTAIYQIDGSGFTGFFTRRAVVNGDGLVNTYEYARRARDNRLGGYLDEQGICYIITNVAVTGGVIVDFGGLRVEAAEVEEVLRTPTYSRFPTTDFVLHRRHACGADAQAAARRGLRLPP